MAVDEDLAREGEVSGKEEGGPENAVEASVRNVEERGLPNDVFSDYVDVCWPGTAQNEGVEIFRRFHGV